MMGAQVYVDGAPISTPNNPATPPPPGHERLGFKATSLGRVGWTATEELALTWLPSQPWGARAVVTPDPFPLDGWT